MLTRFGDFTPRNFDRGFQGEVSARAALQMSLNVPAVAILDRLGPTRLVQALNDAGAALEFDRRSLDPRMTSAIERTGRPLTGRSGRSLSIRR